MRIPPDPSRPQRHHPRRFADDRRAATIVEFAFIAGPLMALIVAILQVSLTFFAQQNLESAAEKSTRVLVTGAAQNVNMSQTAYRNFACAKLPSFMKCANLMVDVRVATTFASVNMAVPTITFDNAGKPTNSWTFETGVPGDILIVRTMYVWDVTNGPLGFDISTLSPGKRLLIATSVFKTELYTT